MCELRRTVQKVITRNGGRKEKRGQEKSGEKETGRQGEGREEKETGRKRGRKIIKKETRKKNSVLGFSEVFRPFLGD